MRVLKTYAKLFRPIRSAGVGVARDQSGIGTSALFGVTGAGDSAVGAGRGRGNGGDNAADE